ncbi:MAG: phosphate/phosphite/phosphonate ABC transporter substrate-binding protein [Burkholderiales bacterium]
MTLRIVILALGLVSASLTRAAEHEITLGVFPRLKATETVTMYHPLATYLSERLNRRVVLATSKDFESFWTGVQAQRYDIVHYNQYHYIHSAHAYRVIAHQQEFGRQAVAGALFVRTDSGITDLKQLRGRTIMFGGGRDAMMSYIAPRYLLMQAGLREGEFKTEFAVNPPNALLAVDHGQADAAVGGDILIDLPAVKNSIDAGQLKVLAATEPLLFLPWAVKRSMPPKLADEIQSLLVNLGQTEAGREVLKAAKVTGMARATDKDYDAHRRMTKAVFGNEGIAR